MGAAGSFGGKYGIGCAHSFGSVIISRFALTHKPDGELIPRLTHKPDGELIPRLIAKTVTFKRQDMQTGVEPDDCFYIQNQAAVRGKDRLDLTVDPVPDLAIEIDNSSQTSLNCYEALGVPELWSFDGEVLKIYLLQEGKYIESSTSQNFPDFPIIDLIPQYVDRANTQGRSPTIRAFRAWLREQLQGK